MRDFYGRRIALILVLGCLRISQVLAQCNTNKNPYCAGNSKFEQLCCPYPAVCYWSDRYGGVGCCQAGHVCVGNGNGVTITPTPIPPTRPVTTQTLLTGATLATTPNGGYSTITVTGGAPITTPVGYTTTAGVIIANDASRRHGSVHATDFFIGLAIWAWILA